MSTHHKNTFYLKSITMLLSAFALMNTTSCSLVGFAVDTGMKISSEVKSSYNLSIAAEKGNMKDVETYIERGTNVNAKCTNEKCAKYLPLTAAALNGHLEIVKKLLAAGAIPNTDALNAALVNNNSNIIKELLAAGAKPDENALCVAAKNNNLEAVKALLAVGAKYEERYLGNNPLYIAVKNKQPDIINVLVEAGAKTYGDALLVAVEANRPDVVKTILTNGFVDPNLHYLKESLELAFKNNNPNVIKEFIVNEYGNSLIEIALNNNRIDTLQMLVAAGAKSTNIYSLKYAVDNNRPIIAKLLMAAGADIHKTFTANLRETSLIDYALEQPLQTNMYRILLSRELDIKTIVSISNLDDALEDFKKYIAQCLEAKKPNPTQIEKKVLSDLKKMKEYSSFNDEQIKQTKKFNDDYNYNFNNSVERFRENYNDYKLNYQIRYIAVSNDSLKPDLIYEACNCTNDIQNSLTTSAPNTFNKLESCFNKFGYFKLNYTTTKNYFLDRLQKDINDYAATASKIRATRAKQNEAAQKQFIRSISPRENCENRCNNSYKKNSDSWKHCMSSCADLRSDVIER